jgi:hypothetical protein
MISTRTRIRIGISIRRPISVNAECSCCVENLCVAEAGPIHCQLRVAAGLLQQRRRLLLPDVARGGHGGHLLQRQGHGGNLPHVT